MVGENQPALEGWRLPPRCCGTWVDGIVCPICSEYVAIGDNIELGGRGD